YDAQDNMVGVAVESSTEKGFNGHLGVMVGFDTEGNITGYNVLETTETPGLGSKADQWFQKDGKGNVIGMNPESNNISVKKDGGDVDAITAATISSRAFCDAINRAYKAFQIVKGGTDNE
ncbi:MAG: RnfABCDGE type electron transport complex subunit G, partial [Bacteroidales bacterium]|nr:RnfABCDGE type electron transport complex subunit G [Bacteroidales bacterium]